MLKCEDLAATKLDYNAAMARSCNSVTYRLSNQGPRQCQPPRKHLAQPLWSCSDDSQNRNIMVTTRCFSFDRKNAINFIANINRATEPQSELEGGVSQQLPPAHSVGDFKPRELACRDASDLGLSWRLDVLVNLMKSTLTSMPARTAANCLSCPEIRRQPFAKSPSRFRPGTICEPECATSHNKESKRAVEVFHNSLTRADGRILTH